MARQSTTPIQFNRTQRIDSYTAMTSGRAGVVVPVAYLPVLRGDSVAGRVGIDVNLGRMPRPLQNAVHANMQAWFVPKTAHPQFSGMDEFRHSYQGEPIKTLGAADRTPPPFYTTITGTPLTTAAGSAFFKTLGIHVPAGSSINSDLIDAFVLIYNFRQAAMSSALPRRKYYAELPAEALALPRAPWPSGRFGNVVNDYERALVVGSLDLDVTAGRIPITGLFFNDVAPTTALSRTVINGPSAAVQFDTETPAVSRNISPLFAVRHASTAAATHNAIFGEMASQSVVSSLADIDKARLTQAFAKIAASYAGNDATGFDNDSVIMSELLQGFSVQEDEFKRPWLLDSKRVTFGMSELPATDGASLGDSMTEGQASAALSLNVPSQDSGGWIIVTVEVLPERLDERQLDAALHITATSQLPDALRDVQRVEPVDLVLNKRLDAKHATPDALYGYEPMNNVWNRSGTRLGGAYYQATPGASWTEQRSAIWQAEILNPTYTTDHFLAPAPFPHDVFSDTVKDSLEIIVRHHAVITGLTQIGDMLVENNDDYARVAEGTED